MLLAAYKIVLETHYRVYYHVQIMDYNKITSLPIQPVSTD